MANQMHLKYLRIPVMLFSLSPLLFLTLYGCGTLPNGRGWGQDATLSPGWDRIKMAAIKASSSPETWAPVAVALALQIDDLDGRISDWASANTPVFGSRGHADKWSDHLVNSSGAVYLITVLATPSGDDPPEWLKSKFKGLMAGTAAWGLTAGATDLLKGGLARTRPDGSEKRSLPSGHTSAAASFTTLARYNIRMLSLPSMGAAAMKMGVAGIAAGTAWATIEANRHYPSDVLSGYALGHFLSTFINDAFLGTDYKKDAFFIIDPLKDGVMVSMHWQY
jgi:hypothetical protein